MLDQRAQQVGRRCVTMVEEVGGRVPTRDLARRVTASVEAEIASARADLARLERLRDAAQPFLQ